MGSFCGLESQGCPITTLREHQCVAHDAVYPKTGLPHRQIHWKLVSLSKPLSQLPYLSVSTVARPVENTGNNSSQVKLVSVAPTQKYPQTITLDNLTKSTERMGWQVPTLSLLHFPFNFKNQKKKNNKRNCWHTGLVYTNVALTRTRRAARYGLLFFSSVTLA